MYDRPEDLDAAILDRCDESLFFPLPDTTCREKLLHHYFDVTIRRMEQMEDKTTTDKNIFSKIRDFFHKTEFVIRVEKDAMNDRQLKRIAVATETFSGREIAKLMIAIQGAAYGSNNGILSSKMIDDIVKVKVADHKAKRKICGLEAGIPQSADIGND
jgi:ATPase family AAA domain-containing protein 3A/B